MIPLLILPRQAGKTTAAIKWCAQNKGTIIVSNRQRVDDIQRVQDWFGLPEYYDINIHTERYFYNGYPMTGENHNYILDEIFSFDNPIETITRALIITGDSKKSKVACTGTPLGISVFQLILDRFDIEVIKNAKMFLDYYEEKRLSFEF